MRIVQRLQNLTSLFRRELSCAIALVCIPVCGAFAEDHPGGVPQLSSMPGAPYTVYLDVGGFNFNGQFQTLMGNPPEFPGFSAALNDVPATGTFSAYDQTEIRALWATTAQAYRSFNVNVTTVDPAVVAGQAATDADRQNYYNLQQKVMHTVVGRQNSKWAGPTGTVGVSNYAVFLPPAFVTAINPHTNFAFTEDSYFHTGDPVADGTNIGDTVRHENGHAFGLDHQSDAIAGSNFNLYSQGDVTTGNGSYGPIMGKGLQGNHQRSAWRSGAGDASAQQTTPQNDVATMFKYNRHPNPSLNMDFGYVDSGFGHTFATASPLPLTGSNVNPAVASGVISPIGTGPLFSEDTVPPGSADPLGASNYTRDIFAFASDGVTPIFLTAHDGTNFLSPNEADPSPTLRSMLKLYDSSFGLVGTASEDPSTLFETYSGLLSAGTYYAEVSSFGGHIQNSPAYEPASYYDMGGYFLTGSGLVAVPEPTVLGLLSLPVLMGLSRRRRKSNRSGRN